MIYLDYYWSFKWGSDRLYEPFEASRGVPIQVIRAEKGSSRTIQHRGRVERPWKNVQWSKKQRVASRMLSLWHSWRCWEFNIQEPQEFDNAGLQHLMKQNYWACVHRKIRATPGLITKLLVHILWEGVMRLQDILPCAWKNSKETVHCQRFKNTEDVTAKLWRFWWLPICH